jgi:hypothetical protein
MGYNGSLDRFPLERERDDPAYFEFDAERCPECGVTKEVVRGEYVCKNEYCEEE